jgi:hypothetical protein
MADGYPPTMPKFQVRTSTTGPLAQKLRSGSQFTVDIGEGEVANAELVGVAKEADGASMVLTYTAPRAALAMYVGDERVEVQVLEG